MYDYERMHDIRGGKGMIFDDSKFKQFNHLEHNFHLTKRRNIILLFQVQFCPRNDENKVLDVEIHSSSFKSRLTNSFSSTKSKK
jgi:hypothetical protein